jgi:hypothetical protein
MHVTEIVLNVIVMCSFELNSILLTEGSILDYCEIWE